MSNTEFVKKAVTELFINGDITALDRYWAQNYIQHNPHFPSGTAGLKNAIMSMPLGSIKYELDLATENGDFVMLYGRYTGLGPKPMVAVDIFRVEDGKLAEHWDVLQEEVPVEQTVSKNSMFPIIG